MSEMHSMNISAGHVDSPKVELVEGMEILCTKTAYDNYIKGEWYKVCSFEDRLYVRGRICGSYYDETFASHFDLSNPRHPEAQQSEVKRLFELLEKQFKGLFVLAFLHQKERSASTTEISEAWDSYCLANNLNHLK